MKALLKKIIAYAISFALLMMVLPMTMASADASTDNTDAATIVGVAIVTKEVIVTETDELCEYDEAGEELWYDGYNPWSFIEYYKVTMSDNTEIVKNSWDSWFNHDGIDYYVRFESDQSYHKQWKIGEHTITFIVEHDSDGDDVWTPYPKDFVAKIIDVPNVQIAITPRNVYKESGGGWEIENGELYYVYPGSSFVESCTVTINGTPYDATYNDDEDRWVIEYNGGVYEIVFSTDQSYENQWGVGKTGKITAQIMDGKTTFTSNIVDSPVADIALTAKDLHCDEKDYDIWDDAAQAYCYLFNYTKFFTDYTITLKDGNEISGSISSANTKDDDVIYFEYDGLRHEIRLAGDQSPSNQWKAGSHTITATSAGFSKPFTVNVIHNHKEVLTPASFTEDGSIEEVCACGDVKSSIPIARVLATLSETKYTYDGEAKKPVVTVKDTKGNLLVEGTDYTVTYPSDSCKAGSYGVLVTLMGTNYSGSITLNYVIEDIAVPDVPKTGDDSNIGLWLGLCAIALGGLAANVIVGMKRKKNDEDYAG